MKRCTRCVLPETVPGIDFDDQGVCKFCRTYLKIEYLGEEKLREHLEFARAQKKKYDCIVPLSGGRDSSYLLYWARTQDLNALAVNYDNEFATDQAVQNIKNACAATGFDLISFRSRNSLARKIAVLSIKNSIDRGLKGLASSPCDACNYGFRAVVFLMARQYEVPLILWGDSKIEETLHMTGSGLHVERGGLRKLTGKFKPANLKCRFHKYRQRAEFPSGGNLLRDFKLDPPVLDSPTTREIYPFHHFPWDRREIKEKITSELGWRKPDQAVSTWRTDCRLEPLLTFCFKNVFGCSKSCFGYHNMINEGQMSRERALAQEEQTTWEFTDELAEFLAHEIGLSAPEIARIRSMQRFR